MSRIGKGSAANVAAKFRSSFPHIQLSLLVGICGGVPFTDGGKRETTLGDIIISTQFVQTNFGRQYSDTFVRKSTPQDNLGRPNLEIGAFLSSLQNKVAQTKLKDQIRNDLTTIFEAEDFKSLKYPGVCEDRLFEKTYRHKHQHAQACTICARSLNPEDSVCENALNLPCAELGCDVSQLIPCARIQKANNEGCASYNLMVHFGVVAFRGPSHNVCPTSRPHCWTGKCNCLRDGRSWTVGNNPNYCGKRGVWLCQ